MEPAGSTFFYALVFFLLLAPLYKAGNRPLPLLLLELGAAGFLFVLLVARPAPVALPRTLVIALAILLAYPLLQLVPIPEAWWRALPGHAEYAAVVDRLVPGYDGGVRRALSVVPAATEYGWLAMLPPLACLLVTLRLRAEDVTRLLLVMAAFAGAEGFLGLMQVGAGGDSIFYLRNERAFGTAVGTFVNRNHLAAMLAMTLPVIIGLLAYSIRHERRRHRHKRGFSLDTNLLSQRALLFASAVLIFVCLLFTRSRAGIATALIGLACSSILLARVRGGGRQSNLLVGGLVAAGVLLALTIGAAPILERIEPEQLRLGTEGRMAIYTAALRAAVEFLPFGSGLSTFANVFPRFQTSGFGGYVDYAHNDYLQAFVELGLAAPVIIGLLFAAYGARLIALLQRAGGRSFTILQIAAGVGMLPMILHSLFDFGLHMPANAMWFATLAGVMFHRGVEDGRGRESSREASRNPGVESEPLGQTSALPTGSRPDDADRRPA